MTKAKTNSTGTMPELFKLSDPNFHAEIGIYPKWRVGDSVGNAMNEIYPFYDADQCEEILDAVCEIGGWGCEYREVAKMLFCSISILTVEGLIEKSDAGGARASRKTKIEDVDKATFEAKTAASGAFVRAAAKWGIGRHLSLLPKIQLKNMGHGKMQTPKNEILDGPAALSAWCNKANPAISHLVAVYTMNKELFESNDRAKSVLTEMRQLLEGGVK